jgi:hypothetical protein
MKMNVHFNENKKSVGFLQLCRVLEDISISNMHRKTMLKIMELN